MNSADQQLTKKERRELKRKMKVAEKQNVKRMKFMKKIALWCFAAILVTIAGLGIWKLSQSSDYLNFSPETILKVNEADHTKGNNTSGITLIEYSDFQCPACSAYYSILKQLNQEFTDKILFAYRHFPLKQHANAQLAARAAEAASRQNKFWEMHDLLFEHQGEWSDQKNAKEKFIEYAQSLNLDMERFKNDLTSKEIKQKVANDYNSGVRLGVNATPTFFLNGKKLQNIRSYEEFKNFIQTELKRSN